jgi:hypothetical protein
MAVADTIAAGAALRQRQIPIRFVRSFLSIPRPFYFRGPIISPNFIGMIAENGQNWCGAGKEL